MEQGPVLYSYYIQGSQTNPDDSMELDSHGDRFLNYFYYILGSLPNADESMELGSQRARSGSNYY